MADVLLASRLQAQDHAAWIALARFAGLLATDIPDPSAADRLARITGIARIPADIADQRLRQAVPLLKVMAPVPTPLEPSDAQAAAETLRAEPAFHSLLALCGAVCPETAESCAIAFSAAFGLPSFGGNDQPFASILAPDAFFATSRGRFQTLRLAKGRVGDDPSASPLLTAARRIDACLADAVVASLP